MFLAQKMLKMTVSTSVWSAQHPIAGRNIQQWRVVNVLFQELHAAKFIFDQSAFKVNLI